MDIAQRPQFPTSGTTTESTTGTVGPTGSATRRLGAHARTVLGEPFKAATWKRVTYLIIALPLGLLCVPLALLGGPAGRLQRSLARRLLGLEIGEPERTGLLALAHAVLSTPLNLIATALTVYGLFLVPLNLGYPLRPDAHPESAWGGPTLAGAWAVHAVGALAFLLAVLWIGRGLTVLQGRLVIRFLDGRRLGLLKVTGLALLTAVVGCALAVPVIHQL
jgi:hypothetical protein